MEHLLRQEMFLRPQNMALIKIGTGNWELLAASSVTGL